MARTVAEIQQSILDSIAGDSVLGTQLTSSSKTAIFRLLAYIFAYATNLTEQIWDSVNAEIKVYVDKMKPHSERWYAQKCKDFQFGMDLPVDSDVYDNTGLTEDEIDSSKIINYAAVIDQTSRLRIKVATGATEITALTTTQLNAFKEYIKRIKDAGVKITVDSLPPDLLTASLKIYYDPLILQADGSRVDGSDNEPVQTAFKNYLKNLPFNGLFVIEYLVDALQKVDGVVIPHVVNAYAKYGDLDYSLIEVSYNPDAGYLKLASDSDLVIEFIPQTKIQ